MATPTGFGGRDYPDFGVSGLSATNVIISDMSELAVRLGGINRFDRLGSVLFQENFSGGRGNWAENSNPAGAFATLSAEYYSTVPYSVKLSTVAQGGTYSGIFTVLPIPYVSVMGFEWHFKSATAFDLLICQFLVYTGTYRYNLSVRVDSIDDIIDILESGGTYPNISTDDIHTGLTSPFHVIKVVADLINDNWARLTFDGIDYDISEYEIKKDANTGSPRLQVLFYVYPGSAAVQTAYIDDVIITMNEPA